MFNEKERSRIKELFIGYSAKFEAEKDFYAKVNIGNRFLVDLCKLLEGVHLEIDSPLEKSEKEEAMKAKGNFKKLPDIALVLQSKEWIYLKMKTIALDFNGASQVRKDEISEDWEGYISIMLRIGISPEACSANDQKEDMVKYIPYQKCPICDGIGHTWSNSVLSLSTRNICTVCEGLRIIPMHQPK